MLTYILPVFKHTIDGGHLLLFIPKVHGFSGEHCAVMGGVESLLLNMEALLFDLNDKWNLK
jgi:hypothetical protein